MTTTTPAEDRKIMKDRVEAFLKAIRPFCYIMDAGGGEYIIDGVINVEEALRAADAASSPSVCDPFDFFTHFNVKTATPVDGAL